MPENKMLLSCTLREAKHEDTTWFEKMPLHGKT